MPVGIDAEIVGVRAIGILKPRIAVVRITIFELGIGRATDLLLDTGTDAVTVKVVVTAGRGGAVIRGQIEPGVGVAALGVDHRRGGDDITDARTGIEVTALLDCAITECCGTGRTVADIAGRPGDFAFGTDHEIVDRDVIAEVAAIGQAVCFAVAADVGIRATAGLQLVIAEDDADARAGEGAVVARRRRPVLRKGRGGKREAERGCGGEGKLTHSGNSIGTTHRSLVGLLK